jgi:uncharacterized OsmC-like protein
MLKRVIQRAECRVEIDYHLQGSVLKGTVKAGVSACRSHFIVDSQETREAIEEVIRLAKHGCFAEQLVSTAVPIDSTFEVNGVVTRVEV